MVCYHCRACCTHTLTLAGSLGMTGDLCFVWYVKMCVEGLNRIKLSETPILFIQNYSLVIVYHTIV